MSASIKRLSPGPDIDLLMVGTCNENNISMANSILGRKEFDVATESNQYHIGRGEIDGRVIQVVNTPNVVINASEYKDSANGHLIKIVSNVFNQFPFGFSALLLVMPYTIKITFEQLQIVEIVKHIFGQDIVRKHIVLVFLHEQKIKDNVLIWCQQQDSEALAMLKECFFRCVFFDDCNENGQVTKSKVIELFIQIDKIREHQRLYTNDSILAARKLREHSKISEYILQEIDSTKEWIEKGGFKGVKDKISDARNVLESAGNSNFIDLKTYLESVSLLIFSIERKTIRESYAAEFIKIAMISTKFFSVLQTLENCKENYKERLMLTSDKYKAQLIDEMENIFEKLDCHFECLFETNVEIMKKIIQRVNDWQEVDEKSVNMIRLILLQTRNLKIPSFREQQEEDNLNASSLSPSSLSSSSSSLDEA